MSKRHPVVSVTGSSGAGTSTVKRAFEHIFKREGITPAVVEGDSYHRYERAPMKEAMAAALAKGENFSHFGPEANLFEKLEELFRTYGETGSGENAHLSHAAAKELARASCFEDELFAANDNTADRRSETLAKTEGHTVSISNELTCRDAEPDNRIEEARAIDVDRNARWLQRRAKLAHVGRSDWSAEGVGVAVLNDNERGDGAMRVGCVLDRLKDIGDRHLSVGVFLDHSKASASNDGVVCRLVVRNVPFGGGNDLAAAWHMGHDRDEVPHGARGNKEARLFTE
jgi:hypothetical protein